MRTSFFPSVAACLVLGIFASIPSTAQTAALSDAQSNVALPVPPRVVEHVDETKLVKLTGDVHPMARAAFDKGRVDPNKLLEKIVLVLKRSPEQEAALAAFNERQYDPKSPDFHHWLHAEEFGSLYGPSDSDITSITSWLQNHGFSIDEVGKGRVSIQFTGTVAQVESAFHVEMHNYLAEGKMHIANDRSPAIPAALSPVITGIASLHDFFPVHYSHPGNYVKRDLKTGKYSLVTPGPAPIGGLQPESSATEGAVQTGVHSYSTKSAASRPTPDFGYVDANTGYQREELSPYDVATIYNILPLWNAATPINGKGVKVAIVALSDVTTSDFNTYRSSFGLPVGTLTTLHSGADPGLTDSQGENTEDTEMVSATAPGATVVLVADVDNATTNGLMTSVSYIINNEVAPILTMSYGACELKVGTSGNAMWNQLFQQAATAGISSFVAAGDSGSAVCTSQNGTPPYGDQYGLAVSGMASTPYVTAVGGTDLQWPLVEATHAPSTYWNATNDAHGASAKGYMPEMSWNDTCTNPLLLNVYTGYTNNEALCNAAITGSAGLVEMASGSGGVSRCTVNSTTDTSTTFDPTSCSGGYTKPSWQTGVAGIPADGKRDLPDVSMFAAYGFQQSTGLPGSALLICQATASPETSCDYSNPSYIIYQENGGTSAASPMTAGVMALVLQKVGTKQGLANPVFYSLAAKENYAACNSNTVAAGNSCIFYDTTTGSNAMNCYTGDLNCVTKTSGDQAGILSGYAATTGYDLTTGLGTFNVTNLVNAWPSTATTTTVSVSPTSLAFASTTVGATTAAQVVTIKNTGTAAVTLTSETITGTNATSFLKSATTCTTSLAVGASCTVSVEFKPAAAGALAASLSVVDNATGSPQTVALSGTGAAATTFTVSVTPASLAFASTTIGATSAAQVVTVKNTGTGALTLGATSFTGTNISSFLKSATTCTTALAVGASCTISVEFKPVSAGALTAALSIPDNATGTPQKVTLTGTGTAASTFTVSVTPASLAFASTTVGATSAAQVVTVKNTGTGALTLGATSFTGTGATSFLKSATTCTTALAVGASCTISVEFKPTAAGAFTAALSIPDNATGTPQTVALSGTGAAASGGGTLSVTASLTFASTAVGSQSAAQQVIVKNTGTTTVTLSSFTYTGTNTSSFVQTGINCGTTLAANAVCAVAIAFKPQSAGTLTATLNIADNATGSPQKVTLTGTGTGGSSGTVTLTPASLAFPNTIVGATSDAQLVTLTNSGSTAVTVSSIALSGTNPTAFLDLTSCGSSVAAGTSCSIYVAFKPASAAALSATLSVTDNATGSPQKVTLTGTGTAAPSVKLSATSIAFGTVAHGTTSPAKALTLTNSGTSILTLTSIALSGTNAAAFEALDTCGATLAPAASCTVYIAFKPATTGAMTASLVIADNGAASPQSVALTGTGN
jgi:subtilase family serine protease